MNDWQRVTKADPCPICGKPDWCGVGVRFVHCMRVASDKVTENGGWLHPIGSASQAPFQPRRPKEPSVDVRAMMERWQRNARTERLASLLGVDELSLRLLGVGWSEENHAWAFPMVNAERNVVGIRLRNEHGDKWSVRGGKSGVFYPRMSGMKRAFICEGPSDVAALLQIGLFAIGRPSCNDGGAILCEMLPKLGVKSAVIVADHDGDKSRPDGSTYNPGVDGSVRLSERLPVPNCIWLPPCKDAREFVRLGGTAVQIDAMIKGVRWKQPEERR